MCFHRNMRSDFQRKFKSKNREGCFISWNCRGVSNKESSLIDLVNDKNPICVCLQETKLGDNSKFHFSNYNFVHKNQIIGGNEKSKGGVGILIKPGVNYVELNLDTIFQAVAVQLNVFKKVTVCSIYIPPKFNFCQKDLEKLIRQLPAPFILTGDFNSHNKLWFDKKTDKAGEVVESLLVHNNINLLDGQGQTFNRGSSQSHIDLTLISPELHPRLKWDIFEDSCFSDHVPIIITPKDVFENSSVPHWNFNKANWSKFNQFANFDIPINNFNNIDDLNSYVTETIINAAASSIPVTHSIPGKISVPWWNDRLKETKKLKKSAYKKYVKRPTDENFILFQKCSAEHRRLLEESKRENFAQFLSEINPRSSISDVWKRVGALKAKKKSAGITSLSSNNKILIDNKEIANCLVQNMEKISSFKGRHKNFRDFKSKQKENINFLSGLQKEYNTPINKREFIDALCHCKNTATGEDNIHFSMLKHLSDASLEYVRKFYNLVFLKGFFPKSWREAVIIPILKSDTDSKDPSSYRPISLISCLSKLLETIVNKRLVWFLEKNHLLDKNQNGFRKYRNTFDNLTSLITEIQQAFLEKKYHITIFLDLEKAYDTCWKKYLLQQLKSFGLTGCLPTYINNFLYNRTIKVKTNNTYSDPVMLEMGIPQGSSLSATLFLIAVNCMSKCVKSYMSKSFFVDDARISYVTRNLEQGQEKLQEVLNDLVKWGDETGFNFSGTKTVVLIFCNKSGSNPNINLKLRDETLKIVKEKKFLGMILDSKLNWKAHIEKIKNKCISSLNLLKIIASSKHKTNSTVLLNIYVSLILSKLEYGSQAYCTAAPSVLKLLDPIHHQALRICLGAYKTTPLHSLYAESNINSLACRRQLSNLKYYFRVLQIERQYRHFSIEDNKYDLAIKSSAVQNTLGVKVRDALCNYKLENYKILSVKPLQIPPWFIDSLAICFNVNETAKGDYSPEELKQLFHEHKHKHNSKVSMYTDGSKSMLGTGAAVVVYSSACSGSKGDVYKIKLNRITSVFSAELHAIKSAVNSLKNAKHTSCTIYSDSKSALQAILKYDSQNPIVQAIHLLLLQISENNPKIQFCWVPAHCNIKGNEMADKAAKEAIKLSKNCNYPVLYSDMKAFLNQVFKEKWETDWQSKLNNKLFNVDNTIGKRDFGGFNTRLDEIKFTRLRLGHTGLTNKYLLMGDFQPVCSVCNSFLTIYHILIECPKYEVKRKFIFGSYELKIGDILERGNSHNIYSVISFLKSINLYYDI